MSHNVVRELAAPISASGAFTTTSATATSARSADGKTVIDLSATLSYTGTFNGISTLHGTLIFHPNGSANFRDIETFTGTVNGVPGTLTYNLAGTGRAGPTAKTFVYQATLHGVLKQVGTVLDPAVRPFGTYTGTIHFDD